MSVLDGGDVIGAVLFCRQHIDLMLVITASC